jgi:UDP-GlcNAc:undecaprenyl-phosphate/decaprenyl-phosphate GlcNAc-1-phosphate transferase
MSADLRAAAVFVLAAVVVLLVTPLAIKAAVRLRLLDAPVGYKTHTRATPYLGGAAIMMGISIGTLMLSGSRPGIWDNHAWAVVVCALVLLALGTIDDRTNLPVALRVAVEVALAVALYHLGHGWQIFHIGALNLGLTIVWVVGVVNAFNLMDNMDGAAASVAAVSAIGAGALAIISGKYTWAPLCFATAGACVGFLPYNLARPARIFMGDGGSLPIGLIVAAMTMSVVRDGYPLGPTGVVVAALLVGLVILDTTLVTYSRARGGRPVFSGGRDHLTHRVADRLGSPRAVAATLALTQVLVCAVTIAVARAGVGWVLLAGGTCVAFGAALIWQLERVSTTLASAVSRSLPDDTEPTAAPVADPSPVNTPLLAKWREGPADPSIAPVE